MAHALRRFILRQTTARLVFSEETLYYRVSPSGLKSTPRMSNSETNANGTDVKRARSCEPSTTIGTHSGTFHCDEVLACAMLQHLPEYENARIFRSRNEEELCRKCSIIVDVGNVFDHERKKYDHHQNTFKETLSTLRPELGEEFKIRLSSAGLIYAFYGERVIERILKRHGNITLTPTNLRLTFIQVYRNFINEIDAIDNGVPMFEGGEPLYRISTHLSSRIGKLNPTWEEDNGTVDVQQRFEQAMEAVNREFVANILEIGGSWIKARDYVREALLDAKSIHPSGQIILLKRFCPWKAHLAELEKEYDVEGVPKLVIFEENEKSWRVMGVPIKPDSFIGRKFFPISWRGLREKELSETAGIPGLIFVHNTGFIGGACNKEAAHAMAIKSVEWQGD